MLVSFTVDFDFEDEDDFENAIVKAIDYLGHLFQSEVKAEIPPQITTDSYRNPFQIYSDITEEEIPF